MKSRNWACFALPQNGRKTVSTEGRKVRQPFRVLDEQGRLIGTHTAVSVDGKPSWWLMRRHASAAEMARSR